MRSSAAFRDAVSIIIPAYEAAATLAETLASVRAQTHPDWEVLVVDDGSTDETAAIGEVWAARDPRIRCLRRPRGGVSMARNAGIARASHDWLLFLDADDLIRPTLLERMLHLLRADPGLDVAYGAAARLSNGTEWDRIFAPPAPDQFPAFATGCMLHTCAMLFRREVIEDAGGFVPGMRNCQDWDLWQRVARAGARFGSTPEILALYRVRPGSATFNYEGDVTNGLWVLERGHQADPRVLHPRPEYLHGLAADDLPTMRAGQVCWVAGQLLGRGEDARFLLERIGREQAPTLTARGVARMLFTASLLPDVRAPAHAWKLWPAITGPLRAFLAALEVLTEEPAFARRVERRIEQVVLEAARVPAPWTIGNTYAMPVAVEDAIIDVRLPAGTSRLCCVVALEGEHLGSVEVPAGDPLVPRAVVADAVAFEHYWPILGRFFAHTIYQQLELRHEANGTSVWRGRVRLAEALPPWELQPLSILHHQIGWTVFLQELWGRPTWAQHDFYVSTTAEPASVRPAVPERGWLRVEVSDELPDVAADAPFEVVVEVGGAALGTVPFTPTERRTPAHALRAAITHAAGVELARVAVREALVGRNLTQPDTLRVRLATATRAAGASARAAALLAGGTDTLRRGLAAHGEIVIPRRGLGYACGSPAARPVTLPAAILPDLLACAERAHEPVLHRGEPRANDTHGASLRYAPEIIWTDRPATGSNGPGRRSVEGDGEVADHATDTSSARRPGPPDRGVVEERFAREVAGLDGVRATPAFAPEALLALLPEGPIGKALLLGCVDGALMTALASRVERLVACHVSRVALAAATSAFPGATHVSTRQIDEVAQPLPGRHDVVIRLASHALDRAAARTVAAKLRDATRNGGWLILAGSADETLAEEVRALPDVEPEDADSDGPSGPRLLRRRPPAGRVHTVRVATVPAGVAAQGGGRSPTRPAGETEDRREANLPVLRFPPIAALGSADVAALSPARFAEHVCALERAGFYSIGLQTWSDAQRQGRPLPGRPVLLTFDGEERAFAENAWPLLRRHGFRAMLFVVTARIREPGGPTDDAAPLDWDELRRLQDEGVELGSRGVTGRHLSMLTTAEVAEEAVRSRAELERQLRAPVRTIAYPHGDVDAIVLRVVAACGYWFGLGTQPPGADTPAGTLQLPRIVITPEDHHSALMARLGVDA